MKITKRQLRRIIREEKERMLKEVTSADNAIELSEELGVMRDTIKEIHDFCEMGNMDFSVDGQTRVAALMEQVLDAMEEAISILDEEEVV